MRPYHLLYESLNGSCSNSSSGSVKLAIGGEPVHGSTAMDLHGQITSSDPKEFPHEFSSCVWDLGVKISSMKRHEHSKSEIEVSRSGP